MTTRGRPKNGPLVSPQTILWANIVMDTLGKTTGYGVELAIYPEKIKVIKDVGTIRPCKFDKYLAGKILPSHDHADFIENNFAPGTKAILDHPFWSVIQEDPPEIGDLHLQLGKLKPEIVDFLFLTYRPEGKIPTRREVQFLSDINMLYKQSNLDGLTACLGLIQEARYYGKFTDLPFIEFFYLRLALDLFCKVFSQNPFSVVINQLFNYLDKCFFSKCSDEKWINLYSSFDLGKSVRSYQAICYIIKDLKIFKHYQNVPSSCLYLTDKYLNAPAIKEIKKFLSQTPRPNPRKILDIQRLIRSLRRWEKKQLEIQDSRIAI